MGQTGRPFVSLSLIMWLAEPHPKHVGLFSVLRFLVLLLEGPAPWLDEGPAPAEPLVAVRAANGLPLATLSRHVALVSALGVDLEAVALVVVADF